MLIKEISTPECLDTITRASVGRLGCSFQDQPYVVPIYFAYEGEWIYVFSTIGKKIEWMRANPKVCVEIEEKVSDSEWISVLVNGNYEELSRATVYRGAGSRPATARKEAPLVVECHGREKSWVRGSASGATVLSHSRRFGDRPALGKLSSDCR